MASSVPLRATDGAPQVSPSARTRASPLPLIVGSAAATSSLAIAFVVAATSSAPIAVLGVPLPLVQPAMWWLSGLGYLLTPVVVIVCYGWDLAAQRNGLRANRNFDLRPLWSRVLLWLSAAAILLGAWHILNLSVPISEWLGLA